MGPADWLNRRANWRLAFLVSAAAHVLAGAALALIPGPKTGAVDSQCPPMITVCYIAEEAQAETQSAALFPQKAGKQGSPAAALPKRLLPNTLSSTIGQLDPKVIPSASVGGIGEPPVAIGPGKSGTAGALNPGGHGSGQGNDTGSAFFGVPAQGQKIVYVIDRSSSMGRYGALNKARAELVASLRALPQHALFQVIVYNSTAHPLIEGESGWLPATSAHVQRAIEALVLLDATRGTVHDRALPLALALQPDVIYFLTDADDLTPAYLRAITERNHGRAAIHVIELNTANNQRPDAPLQVFARQNRGTYRAVDLMH